jgi:hypothetical protein
MYTTSRRIGSEITTRERGVLRGQSTLLSLKKYVEKVLLEDVLRFDYF